MFEALGYFLIVVAAGIGIPIWALTWAAGSAAEEDE